MSSATKQQVYTAVPVDLANFPVTQRALRNSQRRSSKNGNDDNCQKDDVHRPTNAWRQVLTGSLIGVATATLGLTLLHDKGVAASLQRMSRQSSVNDFDDNENNSANDSLFADMLLTWQILLFAMAWSFVTALLSYSVFYLGQRYCRSHGSCCILTVVAHEDEDEENSLLDDYDEDENDEDDDMEGCDRHRNEYTFAASVFAGFCATCAVHDASEGLPVTSILITMLGSAALGGLLALCRRRRRTRQQQQKNSATLQRVSTTVPVAAIV